MKAKYYGVVALASMLLTSSVLAQSSSDYHPYLTAKFQLELGVFAPKKTFKIEVDGTVPGEEIDFEDSVGLSDSEETFAGTFRWNFGEKWSVWGQGWTTSNSRTAILKNDVEWEDLVFEEGTNVSAGAEADVARIFFGRKLSSGPQHEFGAGFGLHYLKIGAFIEGEAFINGESSGFQRGDAVAESPLPNIGGWYYYSPSPKWLLTARIDWLSASIGDYNGSLWNAGGGVQFQFSEHFGVGLDYQFFRLDADVDNTDWRGSIEFDQSGPLLYVSANW